MKEYPLVSIIVRTCGRPKVLKRALESIVNQDYKEIEIVVIEDGSNVSEEMLKQTYGDINYQYFHTESKKGRGVAGNIGLEKSKGVYLNFLDDDDRLLPNHIRTLVEAAVNENRLAAYSIAKEYQTAEDGFYQVKRKLVRYKQPFNKLLLCYMNYIPIQSILFHRTLFEQYGGFDEKLEFLEDWDLWVRYAMGCDFKFVSKITSVYYTPYKSKKKKIRDREMKKAEEVIKNKFKTYSMDFNAAQINQEMDYILNILNKKGFLFYMKKVRNFFLYHDM